ncbi:MAG: ATP-binding cassette domain-containing protein, partial [Myxococcota bacterium]
MTTVTLARVSFSYTDSVSLIADASLQLEPGWTGLVGPNGAGKTTLLRLLSGDLSPDRGQISLHPRGLGARLCPQRSGARQAEIDRFAASDAAESRRLRGRLGLETAELGRWSSLSPGERKRWQIGAALAAEPGLLLLDEPTNHLDAEARALLLDALRRYAGIGVLVSHDRELLNELTSNTLRIERGTVRSYRGPYERARSTWERVERELRREDDRLRVEEKKLRRRLGDGRRQRAAAESRMRTSKRMKSARDSDARGRFKAKRRRSAAVGLGREIGKLHRSLDRVVRSRGAIELERELGRSLFVDYAAAP